MCGSRASYAYRVLEGQRAALWRPLRRSGRRLHRASPVTAPRPTRAAPPPITLIASRRRHGGNVAQGAALASAPGRIAPARVASRARRRRSVSSTRFGSALPFAARITGPLKALSALSLPALVVGDGLRVGGDRLRAPALKVAQVGLGLQALPRDDGLGRLAGVEHLDEDLLGGVAEDGALLDQPDEPGDVRGPHLRIGERHLRGAELPQQIVRDPVAGRLGLAAEAGGLLEEVAELPVRNERPR